jgi:hypothetical protein
MWTYINTKDNIRVESEFLDDVIAAYRAQRDKRSKNSDVEKKSFGDTFYWARESDTEFLVRKADGKILIQVFNFPFLSKRAEVSWPDGEKVGVFIDSDSAKKYAENLVAEGFHHSKNFF